MVLECSTVKRRESPNDSVILYSEITPNVLYAYAHVRSSDDDISRRKSLYVEKFMNFDHYYV